MGHHPDGCRDLHPDEEKRGGRDLHPDEEERGGRDLHPDEEERGGRDEEERGGRHLHRDEDERGGRHLHRDEDERGVSSRPLVDTNKKGSGEEWGVELQGHKRRRDREEIGEAEDYEGGRKRAGIGRGEEEGLMGGASATGGNLMGKNPQAVKSQYRGDSQRVKEVEEASGMGLMGGASATGGNLMGKNPQAVKSQFRGDSQRVKEVEEASGMGGYMSKERRMCKAQQDQVDAEPPQAVPDKHVIEPQIADQRHQGLGSTCQQLGFVPISQTRQSIEERVKTLSRKRDPLLESTISDLPVDILQEILMRFQGHDFWKVIASSLLFLRVSVGSCTCGAFRENNNFIGIITQPHHGCPSVAIPDRVKYHPLESVGQFLQKSIALCSKARMWYKVIDSRGGHLLVLRDPRASRLGILKPLETMVIKKLPPAPLKAQEELITAAILPVELPVFTVIIISRDGINIILRKFSSETGAWSQINVESALAPSRLPLSRNFPLYASNSLHLLDPPRMRILRLRLNHNKLDAIGLPVSADSLPLHHHILSRTRQGGVCWVALDMCYVNVFILDGASWQRKWRWPVPTHFYTCRIIGCAEGSHLVMLECSGEICCIDVEDGFRTYLKETACAGSCLSFETDHLVLDHD